MKVISLPADFRRHHEGKNARHVGLVSQRDQVEHQSDALLERIYIVRRSVRNVHLRKIARFHLLNAPLDLAHAFKVVGQHSFVRRPQHPLQVLRFLAHQIEQRNILLRQPRPVRDVIALPEQTREQLARIRLHRQRRRRRAERNRPCVGAAVIAVAEAASAAVVRRDFERRQRRILADVLARRSGPPWFPRALAG